MDSMYKVSSNIFDLNTPPTIVPLPTQSDYELGFIMRYFVRRANDLNGFIYEIDESTFESYKNKPFWLVGELKWRISGPIDNVYKNAILQLFPNPSRGILIINLKGLSVESVNAKIYNLSGNLIISQKIKTGEDTAIDVIELPTGQYLISLQDNEQRTIVAKNFSVY